MITESQKNLYKMYEQRLTRLDEDACANAINHLLAEVERLERELAGHKRQANYISGIIESEGKYVP
jgi:DNA gyrase/topoisomerase IV subunit A